MSTLRRLPLLLTLLAFAACSAVCAGTAVAAAPGDLDAGLDADGRVVLPYAMRPAHVLAQPDGKVIVTDSESAALVRLDPDGTPDRGFSGDGVASAAGGSIIAAALQPDGKVVVASQPDLTTISVERLTVAGTLDPAFDPGGPDGDGRKTFSNLGIAVSAMVIQADGRIVLTGASTSGITAVRLTATGAPDGTTYDHAGDSNGDFVRAASLGPDGKLVVAAYTGKSGTLDYDLTVARFNIDGTLDKSLAGTGRVGIGPDNRDDLPNAVFVQPDGKIVVAGESRSGGSRIAVTRLTAAGALDPGFGSGGQSLPDFVGKSYGAGGALQPDGKILVAGTTAAQEFAVARLTTDGGLDPGFGLDGKVTIPFDGIALASAAALQPDGRFAVAGLTLVSSTAYRGALARVLTEPTPVAGGPENPPAGEPGPGAGPAPERPGAAVTQGKIELVDRDAPVINRLTLTRRTFKVARRQAAAAIARGTSIRYSLSEPAAVTVRIERAAAGRSRRSVSVGALRLTGRKGANRAAFGGRLNGRALRRGSYRLIISAVDPAGNRSAPRKLAFRVTG